MLPSMLPSSAVVAVDAVVKIEVGSGVEVVVVVVVVVHIGGLGSFGGSRGLLGSYA